MPGVNNRYRKQVSVTDITTLKIVIVKAGCQGNSVVFFHNPSYFVNFYILLSAFPMNKRIKIKEDCSKGFKWVTSWELYDFILKPC